ncbi:MAG TPA: ribosomal-processing cysteine protease Prp [Clostridia bacterium]|jgi:hypothetical protein|nr:ribosomal-processing cysteine protease Prp [Clostridia bacterium]
MIEITVWRNKEQSLEAFLVEGHAGYADYGQDIVCAAVSTLTQTAILAIEELTGEEPVVDLSEGRLYCEVPSRISAKKQAIISTILETMFVGLMAIAKEYPSNVAISQLRR